MRNSASSCPVLDRTVKATSSLACLFSGKTPSIRLHHIFIQPAFSSQGIIHAFKAHRVRRPAPYSLYISKNERSKLYHPTSTKCQMPLRNREVEEDPRKRQYQFNELTIRTSFSIDMVPSSILERYRRAKVPFSLWGSKILILTMSRSLPKEFPYRVSGKIGILISPVMNVTTFPGRMTRSPLISHDILPPRPDSCLASRLFLFSLFAQ